MALTLWQEYYIYCCLSMFFKGQANGHGNHFYDEELPSLTSWSFFSGVLFVKEFIWKMEICHHTLDNVKNGVLVELFSSVQTLIFIACTAFYPLIYALWREKLTRLYFLCSGDTRFHKFIYSFTTSNMDLQQ